MSHSHYTHGDNLQYIGQKTEARMAYLIPCFAKIPSCKVLLKTPLVTKK